MPRDYIPLTSHLHASIIRGAAHIEKLPVRGTYEFECVAPDGTVRWRDTIENVVTTVGKNLLLDTVLAGAAYTVTGPFMGLISAVGFTAVAAADTMTSHAGWTEAGATNAPTYSAPRKTCAWNAASAGSKALSAALSFSLTSGSNVILKGAFIVFGPGALSTIDNTGGTLLSAGTFSGGDKTVSSGDTLNANYTLSA